MTKSEMEQQMQAMMDKIQELANENAMLKQGTSPHKAMMDSMKASTASATKTHGIGAVWRDTTSAISSVSYGVKVLADAGGQLAQVARGNSVKTNLETSTEICSTLGLEISGLEALEASSTIVDYVCSRR